MKRIILQILALILALFLPSLEAQPLKVSIQAKSAILLNPENGAILYEKNPNDLHPPASLIKIATALFVLDHKKVDITAKVAASKDALQVILAEIEQAEPEKYAPHLLEHDGTRMGLMQGERLSFYSLLHGLLLASGNDAANVIAENCSKSNADFMLELNAYLRSQGVEHSYFMNPHGLHHPKQFTTAYDMAKITALALKNPQFREIVKSSFFELPDSNKQKGRTIFNNNRLLRKGASFYPKAIGVKTGYISKAGNNLVAAAQENGRLLITVLLGYENPRDRYKDAISLFESAFREKSIKRTLFSKEFDQFSQEIPRAKNILKATLDHDVEIEYFPAEELDLKANLIWKPQELPIIAGSQVGEVAILDHMGNCILSTPLYALNQVEKMLFFRLWDFILQNIFLLLLPAGGWVIFRVRKSMKKRAKIL